MTLDIVTASVGAPHANACIKSWKDTSDATVYVGDNSHENIGTLPAYQKLYEMTSGDIIAFIHDDVMIYEKGWDARVLAEFDDPSVGVVGFGGALVHGDRDIYKKPYHISQLGRSFYRSNTDDAEVHGERFDGACDVAVLDGFCLIARRELLSRVGGWPIRTLPAHHSYDYWLTLTAHRLGYCVRLVGIACYHLGGQSSVKQVDFVKDFGETDAEMHERAHRIIYDEFRAVLPVDVR